MAAEEPSANEITLPLPALQLVAPPIRLVSAAIWKAMKQRDVMQYGVLEEFVSSTCESVPGLLSFKHQGKLILGLMGRFILELCRAQEPPDLNSLGPYLERIRVPAPAPTSSSKHKSKKDPKIERTVKQFHNFIEALLRDPTEREHFFKKQFPIDYGCKFDQELEKLMWEFLIRLDQLLPVPNLAQTVSWISSAPPVLEECARAATQPQLLKILMQHQIRLGHMETAASLSPSLGESILSSLSLPPSGKAPSNQPSEPREQSEGDPDVSSPVSETSQAETRDKTVLIDPAMGLMSNEDMPIMIPANAKKLRSGPLVNPQDLTSEELEMPGSSEFTQVKLKQGSRLKEVSKHGEKLLNESIAPNRGQVMKHKQTKRRETESEEEEIMRININKKKKLDRCVMGSDDSMSSDEESNRENDGTHSVLEGLQQIDDSALSPILMSCLHRQPKVIISRLTLSPGCDSGESKEENLQLQDKTRETPVMRRNMRVNLKRLELEVPNIEDKENHLVLPGQGPPLHRRSPETTPKPGNAEDFICDSEDEATKNFKSRLFVKRYYKTKHNTYVPTLREFLKPWMVRRNLLSPGIRHRCPQGGKAKQTNGQKTNFGV